MDKSEIRKIYKQRRKNVEGRAAKERAISEKLLKEIKNAKSVFIYESIGGEVGTASMLESISRFAEVCVPEVCGKDMKLLCKKGGYADKPCDVTVVPLIAFDTDLNRIGFGGGYYDRYLSRNTTRAIGIAFDEQQCDGIEPEPTDIALDMIITPTRVLEK